MYQGGGDTRENIQSYSFKFGKLKYLIFFAIGISEDVKLFHGWDIRS